MAADWNAPDTHQRKVMGRLANVTERKRFVGGSWVTSSEYKRNVAIDDGGGGGGGGDLPAAPAGYEVWESAVGPAEWDFRNMGTSLPAGWVAQTTGPANAGASYRAQNVAVVPGVGLVHTAERAAVGQPAYTGKVYAEIDVPQFCHVRFRAYVTGFKRGVWPSFWARPMPGSGREGEKDYVEIFGGHLNNQSQYPRVFGANWITTPYGPVSQNTLGFDSLIGKGTNNGWVPSMEEPHTYDSQHTPTVGATPGRVWFWIDGVRAPGQIDRASSSTSAGVTQWPLQFESNTTWYLRTDFQISGNQAMTGGERNAGDDHAGPLSADQVGKFAKWTIEYVQIFVPA